MLHPHAPIPTSVDMCPPPALPPGTPSWVTPALVAHTLRVWQPRYTVPLSVDDAIAMILSASHLLKVLWPSMAQKQTRIDSSRAV